MVVPLVILAVLSFQIFFTQGNWFGELVRGPVFPKELKAHMLTVADPEKEFGHGAATAPHGDEEHVLAVEGRGEEAAVPGHGAHDDEHIAHTAHSLAGKISLGVVSVGIILAFGIYLFGLVNVQKVAARFNPLYTFLFRKWYFDELYDLCLVRVFLAISRFLGWFDLYIVDGLVNLAAQMGVWASAITGRFDDIVVDGTVNGLANSTIGSGGFLRRFQTGKLHHYIFALAGGLLIIIIVKVF
jgi:NADH-quinone oxidoreductase subunit L